MNVIETTAYGRRFRGRLEAATTYATRPHPQAAAPHTTPTTPGF